MQLAIVRERLMTPGAVDRDAKKLRAVPAELGQDVVVEAHLVAADRTPVGRVEGKDHAPAGQLVERQRLIRRDVQGKAGSAYSFGEDVGHERSPWFSREPPWRSAHARPDVRAAGRRARSGSRRRPGPAPLS